MIDVWVLPAFFVSTSLSILPAWAKAGANLVIHMPTGIQLHLSPAWRDCSLPETYHRRWDCVFVVISLVLTVETVVTTFHNRATGGELHHNIFVSGTGSVGWFCAVLDLGKTRLRLLYVGLPRSRCVSVISFLCHMIRRKNTPS